MIRLNSQQPEIRPGRGAAAVLLIRQAVSAGLILGVAVWGSYLAGSREFNAWLPLLGSVALLVALALHPWPHRGWIAAPLLFLCWDIIGLLIGACALCAFLAWGGLQRAGGGGRADLAGLLPGVRLPLWAVSCLASALLGAWHAAGWVRELGWYW